VNAIQNAVNAVVALIICIVRELITHKNPDWDSVVSVFLLRLHGRAQFKGIETAPVRFSEQTVLGTDADHDRDGVVPVDTGKGRFSEHKGVDGRVEGKCAAILVAEFLKLLGRPELKQLIEETRSADIKPESTPTSVPALMKLAYRLGSSQQFVFDSATKFVEAIVRHQQYRYAAIAGEWTLTQWFESLVNEKDSVLAATGHAHDFIARVLTASTASKDQKVLELAYVVEALQRSGCDKSDIKAMLRFWFSLMQKDQEMFRAELDRIRPLRKNMVPVCALTQNRVEVKLNLLVLDQDDSQHAHRAAMFTDRDSGCKPADVVLVRNKTGNVQIYTHKRRCEGVSLDNLWLAIRWNEMPQQLKKTTGVYDLSASMDVESWYYFRLGEAIFNGSLTNERPATKIPIRVLTELIQFSLHPQGFLRLCERFGMGKRENGGAKGGGNGQGARQADRRDNRQQSGSGKGQDRRQQAPSDSRMVQLEREFGQVTAAATAAPTSDQAPAADPKKTTAAVTATA